MPARYRTPLLRRHAFSPMQISDLRLWLKADAINGLNDGDPVATWTDRSVNAYTATQGTAAKKPTYKTGIFSGRPAVRYDGTDDVLNLSTANPFGGLTAITLFAVASVTADANAKTFIRQESGVVFGIGDSEVIGGHIHTSGAWQGNWNAGTTTLTAGQPYVLCMQWDGSNINYYLNGVVNATPIAKSGTITNGTRTHIGAGNDPAVEVFNGDFAELVVYSRSLTAAERAAVARYLGLKYGVGVS